MFSTYFVLLFFKLFFCNFHMLHWEWQKLRNCVGIRLVKRICRSCGCCLPTWEQQDRAQGLLICVNKTCKFFSTVSWLGEYKLHTSWGTTVPEQKMGWELNLLISINELSECWIFVILFSVMKLGLLVYSLLAVVQCQEEIFKPISSFINDEICEIFMYVF